MTATVSHSATTACAGCGVFVHPQDLYFSGNGQVCATCEQSDRARDSGRFAAGANRPYDAFDDFEHDVPEGKWLILNFGGVPVRIPLSDTGFKVVGILLVAGFLTVFVGPMLLVLFQLAVHAVLDARLIG